MIKLLKKIYWKLMIIFDPATNETFSYWDCERCFMMSKEVNYYDN